MSNSILVESTENLSADESQEAKTGEQETGSQAAKDQGNEDTNTPEKYKGKTIQDVIEMHQNLEKEYGRQANEVGTYRELVSTLTDVKRKTDLSEEDTTEKPVEVTSDVLLDNPTEAISTIVKSVLQKELAPIKESQVKTEQSGEVQRLFADHPDAETIGADPKFVEFVQRTPSRVRDAQSWVEKQDANAARRLLEDFKDFSGTALTTGDDKGGKGEGETQSDPNVEAARKNATETGRGGQGAASGKKIFRKSEVMKMIQREPEKYRSPSFQKELATAINEGRFVDE